MNEGEKLAVSLRVNDKGLGTLLINGVDLSAKVHRAMFETFAGKITEVTLVLRADEVAWDGEARVMVKAKGNE